jgi:plastocyanin
MIKKTTALLFLGGAVVILAIAGLVWQISNRSEDRVAIAVREAQVHITKSGFQPAELTIEPGMVVTWVNDDTASHRVVSGVYPDIAGAQNFDSGKDTPLGTEGVYTVSFSNSGNFEYYDALNPSASGRIIVKAKQ